MNILNLKTILAIMLAIISINACSKNATNPTEEKANQTSLKASITSSGELAVANETDALVIKQTEATNDSYITSSKTGNNQYTTVIKSESENSEISMVYENNSLFPSKIINKNSSETLNGNLLNYNETEKTFDISWVDAEDGTELFVSKGVKLTKDIDYSQYESSDEETYELKTMVNSSVIVDSINAYMDENQMARINWRKVIYHIIQLLIAIFS